MTSLCFLSCYSVVASYVREQMLAGERGGQEATGLSKPCLALDAGVERPGFGAPISVIGLGTWAGHLPSGDESLCLVVPQGDCSAPGGVRTHVNIWKMTECTGHG